MHSHSKEKTVQTTRKHQLRDCLSDVEVVASCGFHARFRARCRFSEQHHGRKVRWQSSLVNPSVFVMDRKNILLFCFTATQQLHHGCCKSCLMRWGSSHPAPSRAFSPPAQPHPASTRAVSNQTFPVLSQTLSSILQSLLLTELCGNICQIGVCKLLTLFHDCSFCNFKSKNFVCFSYRSFRKFSSFSSAPINRQIVITKQKTSGKPNSEQV